MVYAAEHDYWAITDHFVAHQVSLDLAVAGREEVLHRKNAKNGRSGYSLLS